MTPIDRIRRNRDMANLAREIEKPNDHIQPFPRNAGGLCVLLFAVLPLVFKAIDDPTVAHILGYGLSSLGFGLSILSLSQGQRHQALYEAKPVARASPVPWKIVGSFLMGLSAAGLTYFEYGAVAQSLAVLPVVTVLSLVTFGLDTREDKGLATVHERHIHKLENLAANVSTRMERIHRGIAHLAVRDVMPHLRVFDEGVNDLLCAVTHDPDRARSVRKYFTVYLDGVATATERFAAVYKGTGCSDAKAEYIAMLEKFGHAFADRARQYAAAGSDSLEIELDVLNDYLAREETITRAS